MTFALPDGFSGAALVADGASVLWSGAAGCADPETERPNTVDTRFNVASIGKLWLAGAFGALGIDLDQRAAPLVPELAAAVGPATVRQLLTHTSGMGDVFDVLPDPELVTLADWLAVVAATRPSAPGTWRYSNAAYLAAGAVLERLTGAAWETVIATEVFAAAGMVDSGWDLVDLAVPWSATLGGDASAAHVVRGTPAGGGYSTVSDLHRLGVWLLDRPFPDPVVIVQHGAFHGISGCVVIDRSCGLIVCVLANADPPIGEVVAWSLASAGSAAV